MNQEELPDHPAFLRLHGRNRTLLLEAAETWEAPAGAILYHPGDSGEDLLMVLGGRLEQQGGASPAATLLSGALWGEDRLANPAPVALPLVAVESSRWLRWPRATLLSLLSASPSLRKALRPVRDSDGRLVSGLGSELPVLASPGARRSRFRPSARRLLPGLFLSLAGALLLFLAGRNAESFPPLLPLALPAIFTGWMIFFLAGRLLTEYGIDADSVTARSFDWTRFAIESRHIPIDRIQGVETGQDGLIRKIIGIGTVIVKTSALDGEVILKDVLKPRDVAVNIQNLRNNVTRRSEGRDREAMRRTLERGGLGGAVPVLVKGPSGISRENGLKTTRAGEVRFRKSVVVLMGRLLPALLLTALPLAGSSVITGLLPLDPKILFGVALLPFLWGLYRFEDWRNDMFLVSGGYVVDLHRKPLGFKETRRQVDLASVQNIRTEQKGLAAFLFRYGNVVLVTTGGAADTVFVNVSRPWRVQENLFRSREDHLRRVEAARRDQNKEDLTRFAEAMDQLRGGGLKEE